MEAIAAIGALMAEGAGAIGTAGATAAGTAGATGATAGTLGALGTAGATAGLEAGLGSTLAALGTAGAGAGLDAALTGGGATGLDAALGAGGAHSLGGAAATEGASGLASLLGSAAPAVSGSVAAPASIPVDSSLAGAPGLSGGGDGMITGIDTAFGSAGGGGLGTTGGTGTFASPVGESSFFDTLGKGIDGIFGSASETGGPSSLGGDLALDASSALTTPSAPTSLDALVADPSLSTGFNALMANKDWLVPAIGLGKTAIDGNSMTSEEEALTAQAKSMSAQSELLRSGVLPPGIQSGLNTAAEKAKAAMRSMFASKGMSGSSSEIATLASIDQTSAEQGAQIAMKLIDSGINEAGLSNQLYQALMRQSLARDASLGAAIGRFSTALAGGNPLAKAA